MSLWWLHCKSRRNRRLVQLLKRLCPAHQMLVWTDEYPPVTNSYGEVTELSIEIQTLRYRFPWRIGWGWGVTLDLWAIRLRRHRLDRSLRYVLKEQYFYGLDRDELLSLIQQKIPWLKSLPTGRLDEDRFRDRRRTSWTR